MSEQTQEQVDALVEAVRWARFFIHTQMLAFEGRPKEADPTGEGIEIASEVMVDLATAVAPFDPDQVACKGCASRHRLFGPASQIVEGSR